jgi:hypothetical protein
LRRRKSWRCFLNAASPSQFADRIAAFREGLRKEEFVQDRQLFYLLNLEEQIPADHLLRRLNPIVTRVLVDLREKLALFYSDPVAPGGYSR